MKIHTIVFYLLSKKRKIIYSLLCVPHKGDDYMKWEEVRNQYPNTFVKFEVLEYHIEEDKEVVDEIALIKVIKDGKEAMKEHLTCKRGQYVYNTIKDRIEIQIIKYIGIRGQM